jgi:hypothetical protein
MFNIDNPPPLQGMETRSKRPAKHYRPLQPRHQTIGQGSMDDPPQLPLRYLQRPKKEVLNARDRLLDISSLKLKQLLTNQHRQTAMVAPHLPLHPQLLTLLSLGEVDQKLVASPMV